MTFKSVLFRPDEADIALPDDAPVFFRDLNFDVIVAAAMRGRNEYALEPMFYRPLTDVDSIAYRHAVFRDLENDGLCQHVTAFCERLRTMRERLAEADNARHRHARTRWFVDAAALYCEAVQTLLDGLTTGQPVSDGLLGFRDYLTDYVAAAAFSRLAEQAEQRRAALDTVHYGVLIHGDSVTVTRYDDEPDYGAEITATFERFRQGEARPFEADSPNGAGLDRIEAGILGKVAKLYPDIFAELDAYFETHRHFVDDVVTRFDREIQFYLGFRQLMKRITAAGLTFCYPTVSKSEKALGIENGFDLALADKRVAERAPVVTNSAYLEADERIIVVTGPNQGGKTTFARMFGQLHHLARLGCPVPGSRARVFICDRVLTHFERPEATDSLRGKLEDDLVRMRSILDQTSGDSVIVVNEIFGSTTSRDAQWLGEKILVQIDALDALCVCVTFIDEFASFGEHTVSMASTVAPDNPAVRTFKVVRKPADGLAYARSLAAKHRLTLEALRERL